MNDFLNALSDFRFLKDKKYPDRAALKLVGDRYRLTATVRNCLFRGVVSQKAKSRRIARLLKPEQLCSRPLGIDWFNVLITLESYLKGHPVFIADDGVLRDSSGVHGSYRPGSVTPRATTEILKNIICLLPESISIYIDSPISFSGETALSLRKELERLTTIPFTVAVIPSADFPLKSFRGVVATSDSIIMDKNESIFDLPRYTLRRSFNFQSPDLSRLAETIFPSQITSAT